MCNELYTKLNISVEKAQTHGKKAFGDVDKKSEMKGGKKEQSLSLLPFIKKT